MKDNGRFLDIDIGFNSSTLHVIINGQYYHTILYNKELYNIFDLFAFIFFLVLFSWYNENSQINSVV